MSVPTFASLLSEHLLRAGVSDSELARSIGVRRQTVFRWKEGLVERPRAREDVLRCAGKLRLTAEERDLLLLAAGFAPEELSAETLRDALPNGTAETTATDEVVVADDLAVNEPVGVGEEEDAWADTDGQLGDEIDSPAQPSPPPPPTGATTRPDDPAPTIAAEHAPASAEQDHATSDTAASLPAAQRYLSLLQNRYSALVLLIFLVGFLLIIWQLVPVLVRPVAPVATEAVVQMTLNPPKTPAAPAFPVIYPTAQPGQTLLIVAPFDGYTVNEQYNVAGRIQEALATEIANAGLISTTIEIWPEKIRSRAYLQELLTASNATLVIWGEYDSGRVRVNLNGIDELDQHRDFELSSPDELITTITNTLPKEVQVLALVTLGRLLRNQEAYGAAQTALRRALALEPGDGKTRALINFYLGHLAERAGDLSALSRAIDYYQRALDENPLLYDAQYNLGTIYLNRAYLYPADDPKILADLSRAIEQFSALIAVHPASLPTHHNRGVARYERHQGRDLADALDDFSYIIAVDANNRRAYFHRALTAIRAGNTRQWIPDFEKTLTLDPAYYPAYNGLCWGYALAQDAATALPYCDEAVANDKTGASRDSRAIVYTQLGRYTEAAADFDAYLVWIKATYSSRLYTRYRGPLVEAWIEAVNQGENPFTEELLNSLR